MNLATELPPEGPSKDRTDLERAQGRYVRAKALDGLYKSTWAMIGILCRDVKCDKDYLILGFGSMDDFIEKALPCARSTARDAMALVERLGLYMSDDTVLEIDRETAHIVDLLPDQLKRDPEIQKAAQELKPKNFRKKIALEHPEAHVELQIEKKLFWSESAWALAEETVSAWRVLNEVPTATYEEVFESIFAEWLDSPWEPESPYSNREKVQQRKSGTPSI